MPWARKDDNANSNAKLIALSDGAYRMFDAGLIYAAKNVTEGFIPDEAIRTFGVRAPRQKCIDELCAVLVAGKNPLWHRVAGGHQVNDYLDWNDPRAVIEKKRAKNRERLQRFRKRVRNGAQLSDVKRVSGDEKRVTQRVFEAMYPVPVPQEQIQERTAAVGTSSCGKPVDTAALTRSDVQNQNSKFKKPATVWMRISAIAREVIRAYPTDESRWVDDVKAQCLKQGVRFVDERGFYLRTRRGTAYPLAAIESEAFKARRRGELSWPGAARKAS